MPPLEHRRRSSPPSRNHQCVAARSAQRISLDEAIRLAEKNEPTFAAAAAQSRIARLDHSVAVAGLLPSVTYHNQYLFTQGNGSNDRIGQTTNSSAPRFIANNAVHEYASQGVVNETLGLQQFSAVIARQRAAGTGRRWNRDRSPRPVLHRGFALLRCFRGRYQARSDPAVCR